MKSVALIGSSGFIGRSLIQYISTHKKKINKIYCISRRATSVSGNKKKIFRIQKNILHIKKLPEVDGIIYLIKSKNLTESKKYFSRFRELLKQSKKKPKILFISSGAIYGKNEKKIKISEKQKISENKIQNYKNYKKKYSLEKKLIEHEFLKLSKKKYKISIARCFTFVGKDIKNEKFAISEILNAIKYKKKLEIKDAKNTYRSYMHTDDMCRWLMQILLKNNNIFQIFNVGSDDFLNLKEICEFLEKRNKTKNFLYKRNFSKSKKIDFYIPSINLIKKKMGLSIKYKTKKAILDTLTKI